MNRSIVTVTQVALPKELLWFFDEPPLVGNETSDRYEGAFLAIAKAVRPTDLVAWLFIKDITDLAWETRRERSVKTQIIKNLQKEVVGELLCSSFLGNIAIFSDAIEKGNSWENDAKAREEIDAELLKNGHSPTSILAQAYERGANQIDAIDKRIASYELRRLLIIKESALHCERLARRLEKSSSDAIEGEFTEVAK